MIKKEAMNKQPSVTQEIETNMLAKQKEEEVQSQRI